MFYVFYVLCFLRTAIVIQACFVLMLLYYGADTAMFYAFLSVCYVLLCYVSKTWGWVEKHFARERGHGTANCCTILHNSIRSRGFFAVFNLLCFSCFMFSPVIPP